MESHSLFVELYHEDRRCAFLKRRIAEIPKALAALRKDGLDRTGLKDKRREEFEDLEKSITKVEREIRVQQDLLPKKQQHRKLATNVEQMQSADREIEQVETTISHLEERVLGKLESLEILERETQLREPSEKEGAAALAREATELETEFAECEHELERSLLQRTRLIELLDKRLAKRYERISVNHEHSALAALRGGACGGCGEKLTVQAAIEVSDRDHLEPCQGCGRLIIRAES